MPHSLYMPIYWTDYFADTLHLDTEGHGAYFLLIGAYWQRGGPLPDDRHFLATVTKSSTKKWKIIRPKVAEFFEISEGLWRHHRIEKELLRSSARQASARANGTAGGVAKAKLLYTKDKKERRARAHPPSEQGVVALALTPEQQDRRDRLMGEGKYDPLLKMRGSA